MDFTYEKTCKEKKIILALIEANKLEVTLSGLDQQTWNK